MAEYIVMVDEKRKKTDLPNDPLTWLLGLPVLEEIIRCRDCKHFREVPYHDGCVKTQCDGVFTFVEPKQDGFCAWAERREA